MGTLVHGAAALLLGALISSSLGCAIRDPAIVGVSAPRARDPADRDTDGGADALASPLLAEMADFRSHAARVSERFLSRGHGEQFDAVLWANDAARATPDAEGRLADGALFVEELITRDSRGDRGAGFLLMQKDKSGWHFDAVGPTGDTAPGPRVSSCAGCHGDAKDSVFLVSPRQTPHGVGADQ